MAIKSTSSEFQKIATNSVFFKFGQLNTIIHENTVITFFNSGP